jgi:hypothetical protein
MFKIAFRCAICFVVFGLAASHARSALVSFVGEDFEPGADPTVRTNSDAAHAAFVAAASAIGPVSTITFEGAPLGSFTNLGVTPDVSMDGTDHNGNPQTIRNTSDFPSFPSVDGSNTTAGGSFFVEMQGGNLVFTFAQPTQFFGAYLTGVQTNFFADSVSFNDGTNQSITLAGAGTSQLHGETAFVGFTDAGKFITSVTINAGSPNGGFDDIGVDDVSVQSPEPSTLVMATIVFGILGIAPLCKRLIPAAAA